MENKKINDEEKVLSALTNSKAYQLYLKSNEHMIDNCNSYANAIINDLENYINSCANNGYTGCHRWCNFKEKYEATNCDYITKKELDYIVDYFKDNGFNIRIKFKYSIFNLLFKFKKERINAILFVNWDFSKS